MKYFNIMLNFEIKFIIFIQKIFGGPEENVNLIKLGKIFTNNINQNKLMIYAIIINFIQNTTLTQLSFKIVILSLYNLLKMFAVIYFSKYVNFTIKNYFKIRRPYLEEDNIKKVTIKKDKSKSYSFPSNSIQNSLVFYTLITNLITNNIIFKNMIIYGIISIIALIKTLRGLHYIHDILSGLLLAQLIIYIVYYFDI